MMTGKRDPDLYRNLCKPFASFDAANEAIAAFFEEVYALRTKYLLPDVHVVVGMNLLTDNGEETTSATRFHIGDPLKEVSMLAYAFGCAQTASTQMTLDMLAQGKKRKATP